MKPKAARSVVVSLLMTGVSLVAASRADAQQRPDVTGTGQPDASVVVTPMDITYSTAQVSPRQAFRAIVAEARRLYPPPDYVGKVSLVLDPGERRLGTLVVAGTHLACARRCVVEVPLLRGQTRVLVQAVPRYRAVFHWTGACAQIGSRDGCLVSLTSRVRGGQNGPPPGPLHTVPVTADFDSSDNGFVYKRDPQRIPAACTVVPDAQLLDCWMQQDWHALLFGASFDQSTPMPFYADDYFKWPAQYQNVLLKEFDIAMKWYSDPNPDPAPVIRFDELMPEGQQVPYVWAGIKIDQNLAMQIWSTYIANTIAGELTGAFPWSITTYAHDNVYALVKARFVYYIDPSNPANNGDYLGNGIRPTNPSRAVAFLRENQILGSTAKDTIVNLANFESVFVHAFAVSPAQYPNLTDFWGPAAPPIPQYSMLTGSVYTGPDPFYQNKTTRFTIGCSGTGEFSDDTMRAINIPMESFQPCGHTVHHFLEPNYYTSHADDLYNGFMENTPFISREVLLMTQSEFDAWFTNVDQATCESNIGRKVVNVAIDLLPDGIVNLYCQDVANNLPNDQGMVFVGNLNLYYTMAQLDAMGFWANIKAKAIALGRCTPPK